jgi:hypothetical protein
MGRIRSIKPEFWRDEKIATLKNRMAGYFFIGIWNVADDEGKFNLSAKSLSLELPIFRSKDILVYISDLSRCGLIQVSECSQWGLVVNWHHQKIDRPRLPRTKKEEIQWLPIGHSTICREDSRGIDARIGSDRIGEDRIGYTRKKKISGDGASEKFPELIPKDEQEKSATASASAHANALIAEYCERFKERYKSNPTIGGKNAGIAKRLAKDLGLARAKDLIATYLSMNDSFFLTKRHDLVTFESNLNAVSVKHDTGHSLTRIDIQNREKLDHTRSQLERVARGEL